MLLSSMNCCIERAHRTLLKRTENKAEWVHLWFSELSTGIKTKQLQTTIVKLLIENAHFLSFHHCYRIYESSQFSLFPVRYLIQDQYIIMTSSGLCKASTSLESISMGLNRINLHDLVKACACSSGNYFAVINNIACKVEKNATNETEFMYLYIMCSTSTCCQVVKY